MSTQNHFDVIIIGTGAGGGTLAHKLAPTGKRILLLERGGYVPREKDNWNPRAVNLEGKYQTKEMWHDKDGKELHPHTNYYVGGNTKFYGAALFRLRKEDFGEIRHHGGLSPAWPIRYEDIEPYYTEAERLYHVHGNRGEDPAEPPASAPYPHRRSAMSRAFNNCPMILRAWACARFIHRWGSCSMKKIRTPAAAFAARLAMAFPASSVPSPMLRCAPSIRHLSMPT